MHYFQKFLDIIIKLRSPEGCPWDREQTAESLRGGIIEEAYECIEAITEGDDDHIKEELGDVFLLAAMVSYIKEQEGRFTIEEVLDEVGEKLVRRHPHVFADAEVDDSNAVIKQWDQIKEDVEGRGSSDSILSDIPGAFPPILKAYKYQKKAAKVGFDWPHRDEVWDKVHEEMEELRALDGSTDRGSVEGEIGDLLFAVVNLSRHYKIDPVLALQRTNEKFRKRFGYIEKKMKEQNRELSAGEFDAMDALWDAAKTAEI